MHKGFYIKPVDNIRNGVLSYGAQSLVVVAPLHSGGGELFSVPAAHPEAEKICRGWIDNYLAGDYSKKPAIDMQPDSKYYKIVNG